MKEILKIIAVMALAMNLIISLFMYIAEGAQPSNYSVMVTILLALVVMDMKNNDKNK